MRKISILKHGMFNLKKEKKSNIPNICIKNACKIKLIPYLIKNPWNGFIYIYKIKLSILNKKLELQ